MDMAVNVEKVRGKGEAPGSRLDSTLALWLGIAFSFAFAGLIWLVEPLLPPINFLPDQGYSWYYWKLPEPTFWSRFTAWGGYTLHQVVMWVLIYRGQKQQLKYTRGLHKLNVQALGATAFFSLLHLVQTHIWFDGLAQDVSIWSSQYSVILMLVMILLMENRRRGLFFGKKVRASWFEEAAGFARRYHGYIFAWGIIYTFWYHPAVATPGHLLGFLYTALLMVQGSLMFTRAHVNRWWTAALELTVLVHGTLVAVLQANGIWPMFLFGFASLFVVTQMYGLGLKPWLRWAFIGAFVASAGLVYNARGWENLNEILRIPVIEYLLVFVLALLIWGGLRASAFLADRLNRPRIPVNKQTPATSSR
jgi:hypothetical protein